MRIDVSQEPFEPDMEDVKYLASVLDMEGDCDSMPQAKAAYLIEADRILKAMANDRGWRPKKPNVWRAMSGYIESGVSGVQSFGKQVSDIVNRDLSKIIRARTAMKRPSRPRVAPTGW